VMARAPSAGGKTRLAPHLAPARLAALRVALLADTLQVVAAVRDVDVTVFFTPADGESEIAALTGLPLSLVPQPDGDLGQRMRSALEYLIDARGHREAVLVGADIALLAVAHIVEACDALETSGGVVLGPADDGGYYLIGMTAVHAGLFEQIAWGGDSVLTDTLRAAERSGVDARLIRRAYDIDTIDDLHRLEQDLATAAPDIAPHVRVWFNDR
jgi:uncharacterized protein